MNHNTIAPIVILSAELAGLSRHDNEARTVQLVLDLIDLGLRYTHVQGHYMGVDERSMVVSCLQCRSRFWLQRFFMVE